jgi:HD-like signal output (HDOD) protein
MNVFQSKRENHLEKIRDYIIGMPGLSTTVVKVLETCNNPKASANDLQRVISLDPVLTGRVLKLINSAYYSVGRPISSLTRAIIMLGLNTVKNLALSFAVIEALTLKNTASYFAVDEFWRHSLCVGVVAKHLAGIIGIPVADRETYFVAGLLHDLGKFPLMMTITDNYERVCQAAQNGQEALFRYEAGALGFDHGTIGRMVGEKWKLGPLLIDSLSHHHQPELGSEGSREILAVIALANRLAIHLNIGNAGDHFTDMDQVEALMDEIGVDGSLLADLQSTACNEIDRAKYFLDIVQHGSRN